jgi:CubicO group peptidase (beta-lactamase class C family)
VTTIDGEVQTGYEGIAAAFEANFAHHGEVGAAFALYHRGRKVVDIWGGVADVETGRPWDERTAVVVFSTTKGATATCAHLLAERGELDLDAPVATYWPAFAAEGKDAIPVRWLLSHRAGIPAVDVPLSPEDVVAWDPFVDALAAQKPLWAPGEDHGYHALTYGHLVGEVVRRVSGRSIGTFFAEEIARPLGLELWIGLPASELDRVATLIDPVFDASAFDVDELTDEQRAMMTAVADPASLTNRALNATSPAIDYNDEAVRRAEIPASGGVATARALARMYAAMIGDVDGMRVLAPHTIATATAEHSAGPDRVLVQESRFGLGFWLPTGVQPMAGPSSFGHGGAGGSLAFADRDGEFAFGYVMNNMTMSITGDPRSSTLVDACARAVAGR